MSAKQKEIFLMVVAIALPVMLLTFWHGLNQSYPRSDPAQFVTFSIQNAHVFSAQGVVEGLKQSYENRQRKAILVPVIFELLLGLTGINVFQAVILFCLAFYLIFLIYLCLISRLWLPSNKAVMLVLFLGTAPWVTVFTHGVTSELPFLTLTLIAYYHFKKSNFFLNQNHSIIASFALGLLVCTRPILGALVFFIPSALYMHRAWALKNIKKQDLYFSGIALFVGCLVVLKVLVEYPTINPNLIENPAPLDFKEFLPIFFVLAVGLVVCTKLRLNKILMLSLVIIFGIPLLWLGPFIVWVFNWAHHSTIGSQVHGEFYRVSNGQGHLLLTFNQFKNILFAYSGWILSVLVLLLVVFKKQISVKKKNPHIFWSLMWVIFAPIACGLITYSSDQRYFAISFLVAFGWILKSLLQSQKFLIQVSIWGVILLQLINLGVWLLPVNSLKGWQQNDLVRSLLPHPRPLIAPLNAVTVHDAIYDLVEGLKRHLPNERSTHVSIPTIEAPDSLFEDEGWVFPFSPFEGYEGVAEDTGMKMKVDMTALEAVRSAFAIKKLRENNHYVVLGPLEWIFAKPENSKKQLLIDLLNEDSLHVQKLKKIAEIKTSDFLKADGWTFLLFKL